MSRERKLMTAVLLLAALAVSACAQAGTNPPPPGGTESSPSARVTEAPPPSPTSSLPPTSSPPPTETPIPTQTPIPSRTPKPTPTLPAGEEFACLPAGGERVSGIVAGVIDGDTIVVQIGFQQFTVRYIGIDTPETGIVPPERMGVEARSRNRELVSGERVTLVSDPEVGETDIYDRLLRYAIVDSVFVNAVLVREGLARYYAGENACGALFFAAETAARSDHVGIWSEEP
jgi:endonuclease YncB( thermonuclease family)